MYQRLNSTPELNRSADRISYATSHYLSSSLLIVIASISNSGIASKLTQGPENT